MRWKKNRKVPGERNVSFKWEGVGKTGRLVCRMMIRRRVLFFIIVEIVAVSIMGLYMLYLVRFRTGELKKTFFI